MPNRIQIERSINDRGKLTAHVELYRSGGGHLRIGLDEIDDVCDRLQALKPKMKRQWRYAAVEASDWRDVQPGSIGQAGIVMGAIGTTRHIEYRDVPEEG